VGSAFTRRKVRPNIAMTGEMTLRGKVLPVGGIKLENLIILLLLIK
jgi:ATP-dependent Lon protease